MIVAVPLGFSGSAGNGWGIIKVGVRVRSRKER